MRIGSIDTNDRVLIVAEIGNNHEGNFAVAKEIVAKAAACGVDGVKFQTFRTEHYVSQADEARFRRLKSFELTPEQFRELAGHARSLGLAFISTPFDLESVRVLEPLVDSYKVASGDNNFYPFLEAIAATGKPVIISTGLADEAQVKRTVDFVRRAWLERKISSELAILHCVTSYPVPAGEANLRAIPFLRQELPACTVGYSDHVIGPDAALAAVALGARIIEKHFTLDHNYSDFRDHQLSADPGEMAELVRRIRLITPMLGEEKKVVQPCEVGLAAAVRRSIVAGQELPAGHRVALADLTWIRPAGGLAPGEEHRLVGRVLKRAVSFGEKLTEADVS